MLNRLPRRYPALPAMLEDIGRPTSAQLAKALGVSERTARRWIAQGTAPKPVLFALFWLTSWGRAEVHAEAHNLATLHMQMAGALKRRIAELEAQIAELNRLGDFGAANDPFTGEPRPPMRPVPLYRRPNLLPQSPRTRPYRRPIGSGL